MPRQLLFVQFPHSGYEHALANWRDFSKGISPVIKQWNTNSYHRRKFMHLSGEYLDNGNAVTSDEIYCWGEWEPTSFVEQTHNSKADGLKIPKYVHIPFLTKQQVYGPFAQNPQNVSPNCCNSPKQGLPQNTDPFIFEDGFLYSLCRQSVNGFSTVLQNLEKGSIIVFGSSIDIKNNPYFVVDTVFVVDKWKTFIESQADDNLNGFVPNNYSQIIMGFNNNSYTYTCYKGKAYSKGITEPYSFVPCKVGQNEHIGFERPVIQINQLMNPQRNLINPSSYRTFKTYPIQSLSDSYIIWRKLKTIIEHQGYKIGVKFNYKII